MTTHTLKVIIPNPDLLDILKHNLPGETGVSALYSINGGLAFRIARLAGITATALASDSRKADQGIDSWNDAMSYFDTLEAAQESFVYAGAERVSMIDNLRNLISYKRSITDYMTSVMGESKVPVTVWADAIVMAGEPMPIERWKLDYEWESYLASGQALMTREEYDMLTIRELTGQRAAWAKHVDIVNNFIAAADNGDSIEFFQLDLRTQLSLLMSYATPERMAKFRTSIMKRGRDRFSVDAAIRLHQKFVDDCRLAATHQRYAALGDALVPKAEPIVTTSASIAEATKARNAMGIHREAIEESIAAQKELINARRAEAINAMKLDLEATDAANKKTVFSDMPNDI